VLRGFKVLSVLKVYKVLQDQQVPQVLKEFKAH
jgi:hypothetical protein